MTKLFKKTFPSAMLALAFAIILFAPQTALAQTSSNASCDDLQHRLTNSGGGNFFDTSLQYCNVESVYTKFISIALYLIGMVAVIMIIYGGYTYMTARGNAEQAKRGRTILTWAIIGLIVVLAAAVLVNAVVQFVVQG